MASSHRKKIQVACFIEREIDDVENCFCKLLRVQGRGREGVSREVRF